MKLLSSLLQVVCYIYFSRIVVYILKVRRHKFIRQIENMRAGKKVNVGDQNGLEEQALTFDHKAQQTSSVRDVAILNS